MNKEKCYKFIMVKRAHLVHWLKFQLVFSSSSSGGGGGDGVGGGVIYLSCSLCRAETMLHRAHTLSNDTDTDNILYEHIYDAFRYQRARSIHLFSLLLLFKFISFRFISFAFLIQFYTWNELQYLHMFSKKKQQQEPLVVSLFNRISIMQSQCIIV